MLSSKNFNTLLNSSCITDCYMRLRSNGRECFQSRDYVKYAVDVNLEHE